ncbi:MAG: hypothetical protein JSR39_08110 [Verrucomicrobia bacterium]|nr:hypothetical protein [Verrucomicrobiota bacterium]
MKTLIQQLQETALNKESQTLDTLRLAFYVSRKLKLSDFEKWVAAELNGYDESIQVPSYRIVPCQFRGLNHIRREWQPIDFQDIKQAESFSKCPIGQSIGELENLCSLDRSKNGMLRIPVSKRLQEQIIRGLCSGVHPAEIAFIIDPAQVAGIIDKVRNLILKWALDLEDAGILGEEMVFSNQEKESAQTLSVTNNYNAEVQTVIQSMEKSQLQQATQGSSQSITHTAFDPETIIKTVDEIKKGISSLNLTLSQKSEIEADLESLIAQAKSSNPKGLIIREALSSLRNIFENMSGGFAASILVQLSGLLG